jgi:Ca2+/H+ antiporter, TMEM165/GDT1 family
MEPTFDTGSGWAYAMVFLAAATPVLEVLVVVPAAIVGGLSPVPTVLLALGGNLSTVVLVAVAGDRIIAWQQRRRPERIEQPSRRSQRARELGQRWGVPGLAFVAPVTTGTHIATLAALATGAGTRRVLQWMTAGLVVWAVAAAVAAVAGVQAFG